MFVRALLAFLALPGLVAFALPAMLAYLDPWRTGNRSIFGLIPLAIGLITLLWCVRDFYVSGKGTLAPWDPPRRLVIIGLYRWMRNPMYVAVLILVAGWALYFLSPLLALYAVVLMGAFHLRVVTYEEPQLEMLFGQEWVEYRQCVPRWIPRLDSWYAS